MRGCWREGTDVAVKDRRLRTTTARVEAQRRASGKKWYARAAHPSVILTATLLLLCGPVLIDLAGDPARRAFSYVAADTFYYLQVARNVARSGLPSFDGQLPTNGFHPLWQAACSAVYFLAEFVGAAKHSVLVVMLASLGFVAASVFLLGLALHRWRRLNVAFLLVPFGVYALAVTPIWATNCFTNPTANVWNRIIGRLPLFGTMWSYANGMESGLVLFWFGALAYLGTRRFELSTTRGACFGLAAAMLVLSRLDHGLLILPTVLAAAARVWLHSRSARAAAAPVAAFVAPIMAYLGFNRATVGVALPLSGAAKSSFPYFSSEHLLHLKTLFAKPSCDELIVLSWREAQLWIPLAAAAFHLLVTVRPRLLADGFSWTLYDRADEFDRFLVPVALGVIALAGYNVLFVTMGAQGHWYFPISTLFVTLASISWLARLPSLPSSLRLASALALFGGGLALFVTFRRPDFNERLAWFYWEEAPRVRARYAPNPPKLLEVDDGIVAFALDFPVMSGTLVLDAESARARTQGQLIEVAAARGFDRVASLVYASQVGADRSAPAAVGWTTAISNGQSFTAFDVAFDYVSDDGIFAMVRLTRKDSSR